MRTCLLPWKDISFLKDPMLYPFQKISFILLIFLTTICTAAKAQITVTGRVASGDTPLAGATVQVKGRSTATATDVNGRFSITAPSNATLIISNTGFITQEVGVNNRTTIDVQLQSSTQQLEQIVVVGYGTQKKATLTGSVTSVKGTEVIRTPVMNVSNALAGRLPGLVTVTPSSEPGYDGSVLRIRGINTLGNNSPLIVVDGIPGRSLDRIDPSTIETITVLKDASAAIYGAQAANGVILVTTKRGKSGKPTVTGSFNQTWGPAHPYTKNGRCRYLRYYAK
jgi:TonB-dependent SusC/RagA subfamily outer membrane receptor